MSSKLIEKQTINQYLLELSKEYKKLSGRMPIQLIIIGGSSIAINYNFRTNTVDIDAYYGFSDVMKQAIHNTSEKLNLPLDWVNDDFKFTDSFTTNIIKYSTYYRTFSNVMEVRTIKGAYLVAMKLIPDRPHRHDSSDIIGIIKSEREIGNIISYEDVIQAGKNLYGEKYKLNLEKDEYLRAILSSKDLDNLYENKNESEKILNQKLVKIIQNSDRVLTRKDIEKIVKNKIKND